MNHTWHWEHGNGYYDNAVADTEQGELVIKFEDHTYEVGDDSGFGAIASAYVDGRKLETVRSRGNIYDICVDVIRAFIKKEKDLDVLFYVDDANYAATMAAFNRAGLKTTTSDFEQDGTTLLFIWNPAKR
jgi:hypothetical protein